MHSTFQKVFGYKGFCPPASGEFQYTLFGWPLESVGGKSNLDFQCLDSTKVKYGWRYGYLGKLTNFLTWYPTKLNMKNVRIQNEPPQAGLQHTEYEEFYHHKNKKKNFTIIRNDFQFPKLIHKRHSSRVSSHFIHFMNISHIHKIFPFINCLKHNHQISNLQNLQQLSSLKI